MTADAVAQLKRLRRLALMVVIIGVFVFIGGLASDYESVQVGGLMVMAVGVIMAGTVLYRASRLDR